MKGKVKKIILVFKTHFDIGFTDLSSNVIKRYSGEMLDKVIETCQATQHMGDLKYVWTMPAWPLKVILEKCSDDKRKVVDQLIANGQIVWHALPFTSHTDLSSPEECIEGLRFARELSDRYHRPYPIAAKMTDVPGHGGMLPMVLSKAGVKFLHLGCNEFAMPPEVPFLFNWQAQDGSRILTIYNPDGYGTPLLPPDDWQFPVWMALMQTNDNSGPQSVAIIEKMVKQVKSKYPDAEVVCGTMDDFYSELAQYDLDNLPVVDSDLADTWIHGVGSYPLETGMVRDLRQRSRSLQALQAKLWLLDNIGFDKELDNVWNNYYEQIALYEEHTWGADVKTWLGPDRVYKKEEFLIERQKKNYLFMEQSWNEQRDRVKIADEMLNHATEILQKQQGDKVFLFNPHSKEYTGWVTLENIPQNFCIGADHQISMNGQELTTSIINGKCAVYVENIPSFASIPLTIEKATIQEVDNAITLPDNRVMLENHRYQLLFDGKTGEIVELKDKDLDEILLRSSNGENVFAYRYDRYGIDDITRYLKQYAYRYSTWGIQDYGREEYPPCKHKQFAPVFESYKLEHNKVTLYYTGEESTDAYGDARRILLEIHLPDEGDEVHVTLQLKGKQETPYIESGSLLFPTGWEAAEYRVQKSNAMLNPLTDIQKGANHDLYCMEDCITMERENSGICIVSKDAPLAAIGNTGIYQYHPEFEKPENCTTYINLFNNMWGTNFPQWMGGDYTYRFVIFGYSKKTGGLLERVEQLAQPLIVTGWDLNDTDFILPEGMQLLHSQICDEGMYILLRSLSGMTETRIMHLPGYRIIPVDLLRRTIGEAKQNNYAFSVESYGLYSFLIQKSDK